MKLVNVFSRHTTAPAPNASDVGAEAVGILANQHSVELAPLFKHMESLLK